MSRPARPLPNPPAVPDRADVVVVGGRCAGAATAMLLARAGLDVVVLERGVEGADTLSTHALMRTAVIQLHRWGVLDAVRAAGTPPIRRTTFHYGTATTTVTLKPAGGVDALYAPRRTVLDPILAQAAREAGASVHHGLLVTDLLRDGTGRVEGVRGRGPAGEPVVVRAPLTIGADGVSSLVARRVGAPVERRGAGAGAVVYAHLAGVGTDAYEWLYAEGASAGVVPTNDGLACVFAGTPRDRYRARRDPDPETTFRSLLQQVSPELAERAAAAERVGPMRAFPGLPGFQRRPFGLGWALVGDAGSFRDPLSTHGISDALRDAELLARAVVTGWTGRDPWAMAAALGDYHRTRDRVTAHHRAATEELASYRWGTTSVEGILRRLAAATADEISHLTGLADPAVPLGA